MMYEDETGDRGAVISYEIVDPVTGKSYPVVRTGDTVIITDELKRQVWKDRGGYARCSGQWLRCTRWK